MKLTSGRPLSEILSACDRIIEYCTPLTLMQFRQETHWHDAVSMNFIVIGEALSELRSLDPIQFGRISNGPAFIGLRHRIAHGYRDIDADRIWGFAGQDIPQVRSEVEALLAEYLAAFNVSPCSHE